MEQIRELIRKHIEKNGYTIYSLSNQSGVNRTNIQKVLSGQRRLTTEVYDKLIPFLSLSPAEKEEFDRAFLIDQIGYDRYQTHLQVKNILELPEDMLHPISDELADSFTTNIENIPDYTLLHDKFQIANLVYSIVFNSMSKHCNPYLYIYSDMGNTYMPRLLKQFYNSCFSDLEIVQLLEFRKVKELDGNYDNLHNLKILTSLLPFFSTFPGKFAVHYYYATHNDAHLSAIAFPNYLITNTHVIFLSPDFDTAFFVSNSEFHDHYINVFDRAVGRSFVLTKGEQTASELLDSLIDVSPAVNYPMCINVQPTLEKYFTPELLDKYMLDTPYKDILRKKLLLRISQLSLENHTVMFTEEGLELFTRYGKNVNFPDNLAKRIDIPDRISILEQIISTNCDPKNCTFLMLDKRKLRTSLNLTISFVPPMTTYLLLTRPDGSSMVIPLQEHTICSSIMDFVQNMSSYGLVLSVDETNIILQRHIDELRSQE